MNVHRQAPRMFLAAAARRAIATRILQSHASQLATTGTAACIVHRAEIGAPALFLRTVRSVLAPQQGTAQWWGGRWPYRETRAVMLVTIAHPEGGTHAPD